MKTAYDVIIRPIITEQSMEDQDIKKYAFAVAKDANKIEIAKAVEELFDVKVASVNTMIVKGKEKRMGRFTGFRPDWKKAIVTVKGDKTIEFFDGLF